MRPPARAKRWRRRRKEPGSFFVVGLGALVVLVCAAALAVGAVPIGVGDIVAVLARAAGITTAATPDAAAEAVLLHVRLPRVLLAAGVGAVLAACGCAMQGLFRNPLADPSLIGVSAGAAVAVVAATVLGTHAGIERTLGAAFAPAAGFAGALASVTLVHRLSLREGRTVVTTMLLCGIAVNALAGATTSLLIHFADDAQLRTVTFWTMGSLSGASWTSVAIATPIFLASVAALLPMANGLNAMMLGEAEALHLGIDVEHAKRRLLCATSLGVAAAVSVSGIIGFVALVAPHLMRLMCGPDHRRTLGGAAALGAILLVSADIGARTLASPAELPVGALTALAGAPLLLWLLRSAGVERAR